VAAGNLRERTVVIGGGQAAGQIIEAARKAGYEGDISLVCEESMLPYQRPPLSKQYLKGDRSRDWLLYRFAEFYKKFDVDVRLGRPAIEIDRNRGTVLLDDGERLPYDKLALAMGARSRLLDVPSVDAVPLYYIRSLVDSERLGAALRSAKKIVIIGGGFIGLETAAALVKQDLEVVLLVAGSQVLPAVEPNIAGFLMDQHLAHGVKVVLNANVVELGRTRQNGVAVTLDDGRKFDGDVAIAGVGAIPNVELAENAGLECDNGILVDALARTSDRHIVAAGDCTNHPNMHLGRRMRLETVHNAVEQGRTAGCTIAGLEHPYIQSPWVWSDQYNIRLQSVGVSSGYDLSVRRRSAHQDRFSEFFFQGGRLLAVICINQPRIFGAVRRILNERIPLTPTEAVDANVDLAQLPERAQTVVFDQPWPPRPPRQGPALIWGFD